MDARAIWAATCHVLCPQFGGCHIRGCQWASCISVSALRQNVLRPLFSPALAVLTINGQHKVAADNHWLYARQGEGWELGAMKYQFLVPSNREANLMASKAMSAPAFAGTGQ